MLPFSCLSLFSGTLINLKPPSKAAGQIPPHPKGTEPILGYLSLLLPGADGFWGTREFCEPGEGKGLGVLSPVARSKIVQKAALRLFQMKFPLADNSQNRIGCFPALLFFVWVFFVFHFSFGGAIVFQLPCQIVPDFIYVPSVTCF